MGGGFEDRLTKTKSLTKTKASPYKGDASCDVHFASCDVHFGRFSLILNFATAFILPYTPASHRQPVADIWDIIFLAALKERQHTPHTHTCARMVPLREFLVDSSKWRILLPLQFPLWLLQRPAPSLLRHFFPLPLHLFPLSLPFVRLPLQPVPLRTSCVQLLLFLLHFALRPL